MSLISRIFIGFVSFLMLVAVIATINYYRAPERDSAYDPITDITQQDQGLSNSYWYGDLVNRRAFTVMTNDFDRYEPMIRDRFTYPTASRGFKIAMTAIYAQGDQGAFYLLDKISEEADPVVRTNLVNQLHLWVAYQFKYETNEEIISTLKEIAKENNMAGYYAHNLLYARQYVNVNSEERIAAFRDADKDPVEDLDLFPNKDLHGLN